MFKLTRTREIDEADYLGSGADQMIDDGFPGYVSLVYKLVLTTLILLSGWVHGLHYTRKVTRRLHKPHNIFVANLLISDMITTLSGCMIACTMIISFQLGVESFISCIARL